MTPEILAGTSWSCSACGDCCRGYTLGPVHPEIIQGLRASRIDEVWAPASDGWAEERVGPSGQAAWFLKQVDGHCVFLRPDNLCAVHAHLGEAAKPEFCREFPFHLCEDPRALRATVRPDCSGYATTFASGRPVLPSAQAAASLRSLAPRRRFEPAEVQLLPGLALPLEAWLQLEDALLDELASYDRLDAAFAHLRERLYRAFGEVPPPLDAALGERAFAAVLAALQMVLPKALQDEGGQAHQVAFLRERLAELARLDPSASPRESSANAHRYGVVVLRSALHQRAWESAGDVGAGMGRLALHMAIADQLAAGDLVEPRSWAQPYVSWSRLFANGLVQWVLGRARPALHDAFRYGLPRG